MPWARSSLLSGVDWSKPVPRKYDIGMNEYVGDTAFQQSESANSIKKAKENALSLSLKKSSAPPPKRPRTTSGNETAPARFDFGHYDEMSVPKNTKKNNQWAYKRGLRPMSQGSSRQAACIPV